MSNDEQTVQSLRNRLETMEGRAKIAELCSNYCYRCDEQDVEGLTQLFTDSATVSVPAFSANIQGHAAIRQFYETQLAGITVSNHWTHDLVVIFSDSPLTQASGVVAAHAEVSRGNVAYISAMRYVDAYALQKGQWLIQSRQLNFLYYMPVDSYAKTFTSDQRILVV